MSRSLLFGVLLLLVAAGALALRLPYLRERPMHGDEAVHAAKFRDLWEERSYTYDPNEFHGPTLYYATLPVVWAQRVRAFADTTEATYRLVPVLFGVGLILLLWLLADGLGRPAGLCAGVLTALSPAMLFYSRYYIQEMLLAFFTLLAIAAGWRYARSRKIGWALLAGAALGLMHATKETCVLAYAAMAGALLLTHFWTRRAGGAAPSCWGRSPDRAPSCWGPPSCWGRSPDRAPSRWGRSPDRAPSCWGRSPDRAPRRHLLAAAVVGLATSALFLSGFLAHPSGPLDSLRSYIPWVGRAGGTHLHDHPWHYYLGILLYCRRAGGPFWSEGLILGLALLGLVAGMQNAECRMQNSRDPKAPALAPTADARTQSASRHSAFCILHSAFVRFLALYTLLLTAIYSAIPYKTPWCLLSFLNGMILLAGVGAVALVRRLPGVPLKALACLLLLAGAAHLGRQAHRASYLYAADTRNPYVYAHPVPDVVDLGERIEALAAAHPRGREVVVKVIAKDHYYWPIPWYLRRLGNVGYWAGLPDDPAAPVVLAASEFDAELTKRLDATHLMTGYYGLRPGVSFELWVDLKLWEQYLKRRQAAPPDDEEP